MKTNGTFKNSHRLGPSANADRKIRIMRAAKTRATEKFCQNGATRTKGVAPKVTLPTLSFMKPDKAL